MKLALLWAAAAVVLAGCQRPMPPSIDSGTSDTRTMGAASAPASRPASSPQAAASPTAEDLNAGRSILLQGAPGAAACASCHGADAQGNAQAAIPRLAGLKPSYIGHQLDSFADGTRAQPVMTSVAGALSAQQRRQVASYLATLGATPPGAAASAAAPAIAVRGDDARQIPACVSCHATSASGTPTEGPELAGQGEAYLAAALASWKSGARHNDASGRMPVIAKSLTDAEAKTLAAFYAAVPASAAGR